MSRCEVEGGHLRPGDLGPWLREVLRRYDLPHENIPHDTSLESTSPEAGYIGVGERDALMRWLLAEIWPRLRRGRTEGEMPVDTLAVVVEAVDALIGSTRVQSKYGSCVALAALWLGIKWAEESEEQIEAGALVRASRCSVSVQELARMERALCRRLGWNLRPHRLLLLVQELLKVLLPSPALAQLLLGQVFPRLRAVLACATVLNEEHVELSTLALAIMAPVGVHLLVPEVDLRASLISVERARDALDYAGVDEAFLRSTPVDPPRNETTQGDGGWTTVNRRKRRRIRSSKDSTSSISACSGSGAVEDRRPRVALGNVSNLAASATSKKMMEGTSVDVGVSEEVY